MLSNIIIMVWVALVAAACIVIVKKGFNKSNQYGFQDYNLFDVPYITLDIQGHKLNMIVDTGCGVSLIHKDAIEKFNLDYTVSKKKTQLSALTDETVKVQNILVEYDLAGKKVKDQFSIYSGGNFGNFSHLYKVDIHGLLGTDFFDAHKCIVDFINHCVIVQ